MYFHSSCVFLRRFTTTIAKSNIKEMNQIKSLVNSNINKFILQNYLLATLIMCNVHLCTAIRCMSMYVRWTEN